MSQPGLPWFLARLEEALRQGRSPDAAWICEGRPDLLPVVQQALEQLRRFSPPADTLVGSPDADTRIPPTLTGSSRRLAESAAPPSYEILDVLGRGGMGVVYRARQAKLNRIVALKMILGGSHANTEDLARFLTEAEVIAAIQHPGVVQVYDFGTHDGLPYLAMEFCPGGSLAQKLAGSPLAPKAAADLVSRLALTMQAAHDQGIVHRDLKPANVLLAADGSPHISDFGLAKRISSDSHLTRTGALLGTPSYMAPEQATASKHTGPPADIYALGAILYECLTGRPPFKGATAMETLQQVIEEEPVSIRGLQPKVPRDLETICHKALRKEPARRYATAADLAADLERFLAGEPVLARPVGPVARGWKWVQRRPVVAGLFAAFVLSLVVGTAATSRWALIAGQREQLARQREREVRDALDVAGRIAVLLASNVLAPIEQPELNREGLRNKGMSQAELTAIEELARLPPQIDRVELIRRILDNPSTARKLSWRLRPVLRALVELNLERRAAVLALVRPRILDETTNPVSRLVCARIFGRLGAGDDPAARTAAGLLLGALRDDLSPGERIAALEDLAHLALHLSEGTATWLCDRLPAVARDAPPPTLELLALTCQRACERLPPGPRLHEAMARELLRRLALQAGEESGELALWHMLHAFAIVGARLDRAEAGRSVARLVDLAEKLNRPAPVEAAADVVAVLADQLDGPLKRDTSTRLSSLALRLVPATSDEWLLDGLARTLRQALPGADVGPLVKPFDDALATRPGARKALALGEAFPVLVGRLPASEASRLAAAYTDALAPLLPVRRQPPLRDRLGAAYVAAAAFLDPATARRRLVFAATLERTAAVPEQLVLAAEIAGALGRRVGSAERAVVLGSIGAAVSTRLDASPDAAALSRLARAVAVVAQLQSPLGRRLAERLDREVGRRLATSSVEQLTLLARAVGTVGPWLEEQARRRRVDELASRMTALVRPASPLVDLRALREAVGAVRPWLDPDRIVKLCEAFAPTAVRRAAQDKWMNQVEVLIEGILRPLPVTELVAILRQPSCFGPSEKAALHALERRTGQQFQGVWEAVRWLRDNRPDIDLAWLDTLDAARPGG